MPWSVQKCPFCPKKYANKRALYNHLSEYTGSWRLPTDGHHDVPQIEQAIRRLYQASARETDDDRKYKCWTCSKIILSRWRFTEHVFYRQHCGYDHTELSGRGRLSLRKWSLPFDENTVLLPEDPFPFLRLPLELRYMVYRFLLCFEEVNFAKDLRCQDVDPRKDGLWLQHNPENNLLAIMAVSQQVYNEARRIFYLENKFSFASFDSLPVFLVGIGVENAMLLRSVRCNDALEESKDYTAQIQSCISHLRPAATAGHTSTGTLPIPHVEDLYVHLAMRDALRSQILPMYWYDNRRLVRPDETTVSIRTRRMRFTLSATLRLIDKYGANSDQPCVIGYELNVQNKREGS